MTEPYSGVSGSEEPDWDQPPPPIEDGGIAWQSFLRNQPRYYHRDGTPIQTGDGTADTLIWAELFEDSKGRTIGNVTTLYGERLSTVWLGMDHGWGGGPPLIFETMLFAPKAPGEKVKQDLTEMLDELHGKQVDEERRRKRIERAAYLKKNFPHDQLQLRYSSEEEARERHQTLKLQCLIPPRWRHFLLWTIGQDATWRFYDDEDDD
jgi:hypothetical protein